MAFSGGKILLILLPHDCDGTKLLGGNGRRGDKWICRHQTFEHKQEM
jgi:hypothetical protein